MADEKRGSSTCFTERVVRARPCRWIRVFQHTGHRNKGGGHLLLRDGAHHGAFLGVDFLICEMGIKQSTSRWVAGRFLLRSCEAQCAWLMATPPVAIMCLYIISLQKVTHTLVYAMSPLKVSNTLTL